MEVRRAVAVGVVVLASWSSVAGAQEAGSSSRAAFPDTAPHAETSASSRAGFPVSSPAPTPTPPPSYQPYAAQPQWPQYSTPATNVPQSAYYAPSATQQGWGANAYGANAAADRPASAAQKPEANEKPNRYVSLTISPVHLVLPVLEGTLEVRPAEHVGIAVVGGFGEAPPAVFAQTFLDSKERLAVREFGGQFLIYPLSKFDGFVIGAEISLIKFSGTVTIETQPVDVAGSGLGVGPLLGGKWIHESGFTLFGHLGAQHFWLEKQASARSQSGSASDTTWFPLVNLNAGWSF